jgi:tetratricopeptide (TPR) repeat protein
VPGTLARRVQLSGEAVDQARALGDIPTLTWVFQYNRLARGPMTLADRQAALEELTQLAERARGTEHEPVLHLLRVADLLETGDAEGAYTAMETVDALMNKWRLPWCQWLLLRFRAACAQQEGRWDEAEALAQEALAAGQRMKHPYAPHFFVAHTCMQHVHHGDYAAVEPILEAYMSAPRAIPAWRAILAFLYGRNGKTDLMRREFATMAADRFANLQQDLTWLSGMAYLAEVCHMLGDRERAAILRELLLPYADHVVGVASGSFSLGHTSRYLALLAATLGDDEAAESNFRKAIRMHERLRASPWLAASQVGYAGWLTARKRSPEARPLLAEARRTATDLRLTGLLATLEGHRRKSAGAAVATASRRRRHPS